MSCGYTRLMLAKDGISYFLLAHRVIWALHTGRWPEKVIDHINRQRADNRIENLRDVPVDVNLRNNGNPRGTGLLGVYLHSNGRAFYSRIKRGGRFEYLGIFKTVEEAHTAFINAATAMAGHSSSGMPDKTTGAVPSLDQPKEKTE
jgi:hypothetical protein